MTTQKSEYMKKYYQKNKEKFKKRAMEYEKNHKEERKEFKKIYYQNNKGYFLEKSKERISKNPLVRTLRTIKTRCNNPKCDSYKYYGGKGIKCFLTLKDLRILWGRDNASLLKKPSIDRIDTNKDYIFENCRFIEIIENIKRRWE